MFFRWAAADISQRGSTDRQAEGDDSAQKNELPVFLPARLMQHLLLSKGEVALLSSTAALLRRFLEDERSGPTCGRYVAGQFSKSSAELGLADKPAALWRWAGDWGI
jgi:hypothetical protein